MWAVVHLQRSMMLRSSQEGLAAVILKLDLEDEEYCLRDKQAREFSMKKLSVQKCKGKKLIAFIRRSMAEWTVWG